MHKKKSGRIHRIFYVYYDLHYFTLELCRVLINVNKTKETCYNTSHFSKYTLHIVLFYEKLKENKSRSKQKARLKNKKS